jgi:hypothetical protein
MGEPINEKPLEHTCRCGTRFTGRCDLSGVVTMHSPAKGDRLLRDVAEFAGWHGVNIWPRLNGFNGYSSITFVRAPRPQEADRG